MANVPNVVGKTYDEASRTLSRLGMGLRVVETNPPGQAWDGNWYVDYQTTEPGAMVPVGYMVGVILKVSPPLESLGLEGAGYEVVPKLDG